MSRISSTTDKILFRIGTTSDCGPSSEDPGSYVGCVVEDMLNFASGFDMGAAFDGCVVEDMLDFASGFDTVAAFD